jgi:hypothetical protein
LYEIVVIHANRVGFHGFGAGGASTAPPTTDRLSKIDLNVSR